MAVDEQYLSDVEAILSHRHNNGADLWTTLDKRLLKGAPFSTSESMSYLLELGMDAADHCFRRLPNSFSAHGGKTDVSGCPRKM